MFRQIHSQSIQRDLHNVWDNGRDQQIDILERSYPEANADEFQKVLDIITVIATPTVHKNSVYGVQMLKIRFNRSKRSPQVFAGRIQVVSLHSFITKVFGYLIASFLNNVVYAMWSGNSALSIVYQLIISQTD